MGLMCTYLNINQVILHVDALNYGANVLSAESSLTQHVTQQFSEPQRTVSRWHKV